MKHSVCISVTKASVESILLVREYEVPVPREP